MRHVGQRGRDAADIVRLEARARFRILEVRSPGGVDVARRADHPGAVIDLYTWTTPNGRKASIMLDWLATLAARPAAAKGMAVPQG